MAVCKYCKDIISWERDPDTNKWVPIDVKIKERHICSTPVRGSFRREAFPGSRRMGGYPPKSKQ